MKVVTITTNDTETERGFAFFMESFKVANESTNPMELTVVPVSHIEFWKLTWRSKFVNILPLFRCRISGSAIIQVPYFRFCRRKDIDKVLHIYARTRFEP